MSLSVRKGRIPEEKLTERLIVTKVTVQAIVNILILNENGQVSTLQRVFYFSANNTFKRNSLVQTFQIV